MHRRADHWPPEAWHEDLFNELALELARLQYAHNPPYRRWCEARGIAPSRIDHWSRIPAVITSAFQEFEFSCLPPSHRSCVFYSSGTTRGKPSRHFHNSLTLRLYEASLWWAFQKALLPEILSGPHPQLVVLMPPPDQAPHSSLVYMADTIRRQLGYSMDTFLGTADGTGLWHLDASRAWTRLRTLAEQGRPVLVLATAYTLVQLLDTPGLTPHRIKLPPGSRVMETGGYKGRSRALTSDELYRWISERWGLPLTSIVSEYGMCELSSQAYDSRFSQGDTQAPKVESERTAQPRSATLRLRRKFRFPPWVRVQVIDPETGTEAPHGRPGLLRIFDLANVGSVLAIQTEDMAEALRDGFRLLGRATGTRPRGCSLLAANGAERADSTDSHL